MSSPGGHGGGADERWLITYADMITLLMAFFIMLYAMSVVNLDKFNQLAISVRSGFGGDEPKLMYDTLGVFDVDQSTGGTRGGPGGLSDVLGVMKLVAGTVGKQLGSSDKGNVKYSASGGNVTIRVHSDDILFARGSAELTTAARRTLHAVAAGLRAVTGRVRVEGHTRDLPIHGRFASNWELSAQRAINVVMFLTEDEDVSARRLSAMGFADSMPVAPNTSEANRAQNRRIDIVLEGPAAGASPAAAAAAAAGEDTGQARPPPANVKGGDLAPPIDITQVGGNEQ